MESLLTQVKEAIATNGSEWLTQLLSEADTPENTAGKSKNSAPTKRSRRTQPPERLSPSPTGATRSCRYASRGRRESPSMSAGRNRDSATAKASPQRQCRRTSNRERQERDPIPSTSGQSRQSTDRLDLCTERSPEPNTSTARSQRRQTSSAVSTRDNAISPIQQVNLPQNTHSVTSQMRPSTSRGEYNAAGVWGDRTTHTQDSNAEILRILNLVSERLSGEDKDSVDKPMRRTGDADDKIKQMPRTINNWIHGFSTYASVLSEKFPEKGASLFCYLEMIWGAYKTYGGICWLKYDEQFQRRMAARAQMRWDCQDMSLWILLMTPNRPSYGQQHNFQSGAGVPTSGTSEATSRKGVCWMYNESHCRWYSNCRYKHECTFCGGAHPVVRCFKKAKLATQKQGTTLAKPEDTSKKGKDATLVKNLPQ
ncbi:hypothetical protein XELAEV_18006027mg [Xenopus laevis]|uniref:C3H1-type domain-containing protein n=1 Tax=Xenopus laevis TaxID=8355 RepID=A0A974DZ45_XENLA|nr:hypothetical protein XELAEV_18006027mg [Xenopus laevis]